MKTYTYKKQGDGRDSWICEEFSESGELIYREMIYEDPSKVNEIDIDSLTDEQLLKLKQRLSSL